MVEGLPVPDVEIRYRLQYCIEVEGGEELWINYATARTPEATQAALGELRTVNTANTARIKAWRAVKVETIRQVMDW